MAKIDLAKRRRIMRRSMQLGHCVCDPRKPCPCDVFTQQGICPCAGERPPTADAATVRLTERVHNAGCASKISPGDLEAVLSRLPAVDDPAVLCGVAAGDDAGLYRLPDGTCLVQTVDVMTPCTDEARTFGRICAANCLSDVYAMGGVPLTALSVLAFPAETLDGQLMFLMLDGAMEVFAAAGVALIGGHSIKDEEIKLGFAITGTVPVETAVRDAAAQVGDQLVLTKPLGTGVLNFARQIGRDVDLAEAVESMATLNRAAAEAMNDVGVSAATDVTGFGLYGHLIEMARHSGVTARVFADRLPALAGATELLAAGVVPGAVERNTEYVADDIAVAPHVDAGRLLLGFDAQTSGGLLLAVPAARLDALLAALHDRGTKGVAIGEIVGPSDGKILVTTSERPEAACEPYDPQRRETEPVSQTPREEFTGQPCCGGPAQPANDRPAVRIQEEPCCATPPAEGSACCTPGPQAVSSYCSPGGSAASGRSTGPDSQEAFGALLKSISAGGAVDERTKELVIYALAVMGRCEDCLAAHRRRALALGLSEGQLEEVAWCAIAMGGAAVRMWYEKQLANR